LSFLAFLGLERGRQKIHGKNTCVWLQREVLVAQTLTKLYLVLVAALLSIHSFNGCDEPAAHPRQ